MKVYEKVYAYYFEQMQTGKLLAGDKMPSLRESQTILSVSKTSVETAYMQLADDGYIYGIEKRGYFVTDLASKEINGRRRLELEEDRGLEAKEDMARKAREDMSSGLEKGSTLSQEVYGTFASSAQEEFFKLGKCIYDFSTIGEDPSVSCINLWRRYMKSALRQEERLLTYADNQGEYELRCEIVSYVRKTRNIICGPEDIIIGSGFQSLLTLLIALYEGERSISFPTKNYTDGAAIFSNALYQVDYRNKNASVIYVVPAYMTKWGEVMTNKRRHELMDHAKREQHLIIEDDYQNDFVFSSKPRPSLYAASGGENVAFLGSFSRILLPSVRISYLILPKGYAKKYEKIAGNYNQTAAKTEQIALTQFLRDGHLRRHVKKLHRTYEEKRKILYEGLCEIFSREGEEVLLGESGMEMAVRLPKCEADLLLLDELLSIKLLSQEEDVATLLFSCSRMEEEHMREAISYIGSKIL